MVLDQDVLVMISNITIDELKKCSKSFIENEHRGYIYPEAVNRVQNNFGKPNEICKGISDLLRGWHNNFYRFGPFDQAEILKGVKQYHNKLNNLRSRNIRDVRLNTRFETEVFKPIFDCILDATAGNNPKFTRRTVTGTSKSLSLLAPSLFPMCDEAISRAYGCWWVYSDFGFMEYYKFMHYTKILAEQLVAQYSNKHKIQNPDEAETRLINEIKTYSGDNYQYNKSLLKIIDEYNYAKYTEAWC